MRRDVMELKAEDALLYLHDNAGEQGKVRAQSDYMDAWIKSEKARVKGLFVGLSNAAAEDEALKHPKYLEALKARKEANEAWYEVQFLREAARAHLDAFQTVSANERVNA